MVKINNCQILQNQSQMVEMPVLLQNSGGFFPSCTFIFLFVKRVWYKLKKTLRREFKGGHPSIKLNLPFSLPAVPRDGWIYKSPAIHKQIFPKCQLSTCNKKGFIAREETVLMPSEG